VWSLKHLHVVTEFTKLSFPGGRARIGIVLLICLAAGLVSAQGAGLAHRYSFNTDASDSVGLAHGILRNGVTIKAGAASFPGTVPSGPTSAYIELPPGMISNYVSASFELWVNAGPNGAWGELYAFGDQNAGGAGANMVMFTPHSGVGDFRMSYAQASPGYQDEYVVTGPGVLDNQGPVFVACVYDPASSSMSLYTNGVLVSSTPSRPLGPFFSLANVYNRYSWLGRSLYNGDASYAGKLDEFRVHNTALSPLQIAIDGAAGPDRVVTDPGAVQRLRMTADTSMSVGALQKPAVSADFTAVTNVNLVSVPGVILASSDTNVVRVTPEGWLSAVGPGVAAITAQFQEASASLQVDVAGPSQTLVHRYSFTNGAQDSEGNAHGSLQGGAVIVDGSASLNGSSAYVDLPNDLVADFSSLTLEAWFVDNGSSGWARLWDFGNSVNGEGGQGGGTSYIFLAMPDGAGGLRGAYKPPGTAEQIVSHVSRPSLGQPHHVVWSQDAQSRTAALYIDGVAVASNPQFASTPSSVGPTFNDWLGRSQYNDPYFYGTIDEFRVYNAALSAAEVLQGFQLGPNVSPQSVPVAITEEPQPLTVVERQPATFSVGYLGRRPVIFQWFKNGAPIAGATNATITVATPLPADSGTVFSVALTNRVGSTSYGVRSSNATLTVQADTVAPTVARVFNSGVSNVTVVYSEPMEPASATAATNYSFLGGLPVSSAVLAPDGITVTLTTATMTYGSSYALVINHVRDRASLPNPMTANTTVTFIAVPYRTADIGGASPPSSLSAAPGGFDVAASGADIGGTSDQFGFHYQLLAGDFDIQAQINSIVDGDFWTKAGLMARESLDSNSAFAAVLSTPKLQGSFFAFRATSTANAISSGSFPPNFPNTWLRLQRQGSRFTGYASYDGIGWIRLGSTELAAPGTLYVGMAVASHSNGQVSIAQFRNVGTTRSTLAAAVTNPSEPLGPSSRRTPLAISEIMYKPAKRTDGKNLEYIEIFNSNPYSHDLSGYQLTGDIQYRFPPQTFLPAGGFLVVAAVPADVQSVYGTPSVLGPYTNSLTADGTIRLLDEAGAVMLEIAYDNSPPWPAAADGTGHSLVLARPSYGEADPRAWDISDSVGGSPGRFEVFTPSPLRNVVINEVLAHTDPPDIDSLELYNHSNQSVDLSGCVLSDSSATNKFIIATNVSIPPRGFLAFTADQIGFHLSAGGETIYLKNATQTRVIDALKYGPQDNGVSSGRHPDGAARFGRLQSPTLGRANSAPRLSDVGINEIMYHPISGEDDDQYVELHNHGKSQVNLRGWRFVAGIDYTFRTDTVLAPGGYLVVARNASRLLTNYPNLNATNLVGDFAGRLSGKGERLALAVPYPWINTNTTGLRVTNTLEVVVDEVTYDTGGRWGEWSDGGGSSLELVDPRADKRLAGNWADSDETSKAPWTTIEATGLLDHGANFESSIAHAQLGLLDAGECLVDNVEVRPGTSGANYVSNPGFESGLSGWSLQGCFSRSRLSTNAGYPSGGIALHLRTGDRLWTGANSAQLTLTNTSLAAGQTATLRFRGRWLRGCPDALLRLNGNWLEAAGSLEVPANLGTPAAPNSRALANTGPALYDVTHTPALPGAGETVIVTARVSDPDGVSGLTLNYRGDPATGYTQLPMVDDGTSGDGLAGDGVYSASLPGRAAGTVVAFTVAAADPKGAKSLFPADLANFAPPRECVVVFGDPNPPSSFGAYHLWVTQTNVDRWSALPALSNEEMDATLVCGNRVIYNAGARFAGSPYHQSFSTPYGSPCHYTWKVPKDDRFLGTSSLNKIHWIGNDIQDDTPTQNLNDSTLQREQAANTFLRGLGLPWINRRYVAVYVNGHRRGILMEDALRPSVSVPDQYFPNDSGGFLYKIQPWFEFGPAPSGNYTPWANLSWAYLMPFTTTGGEYKTARYRWNYEGRQSPDSLNNYDNLFSLITAASAHTNPNYVENLQGMANMENWLRLVAANHAAGNWDCFGIQNGQNIYGYVSPQVPWTLFMFDMSIVLGNRISWGPGENLFTTPGPDTNWQQIMANPTFLRMYLRALKELANGAMTASSIEPFLDGRYEAFLAEGLSTVQNPATVKSWVSQARSSILAQVAARDATAFSITSTTISATNNSVVLSGLAPVHVVSLLVNGTAWQPKWVSATAWSLRVPVPAGNSTLSVVALDRLGNPVGGTTSVSVSNSAVPESPAGKVVINEILFHPALAGSEYVELLNRSANTTFDLSGWRLNGLAYTFPPGSSISPGQFLVIARSRISFAAVYGPLIPVFDEFDGQFQLDGETISLIKPGTTPVLDLVVDRVRYETVPPWPTVLPRPGTAVQVVDASQDNSRVGNWEVGQTNSQPLPQWIYFSTNGVSSSSSLYLYLESAGDIYLDDFRLVAGNVPEVGNNVLSNGDFESAFPGPWTVSQNLASSTRSTDIKRSGTASLHLVATSAGSSRSTSIYQNISPTLPSNQPYTLSFWYLQSTNGGPLVVRLSGSGIAVSLNPSPSSATGTAPATPGAVNSVAGSQPAYPPVWLNEVQSENLTGPADNFGEREPWIEVYNAGTSALALGGLYLSDSHTNLGRWSFPAGTTLAAGQFLVVWADAQPEQTSGTHLHTSFRLPTVTGSILLSRLTNGSYQVVDYLNYAGLPANQSYGDIPDGQPFYRQAMVYSTPAVTNSARLAPVTVYINEWMAANTTASGIADPTDGNYEDWFELYNPSTNPANLAGYYLSDSPTNTTKFRIPTGYVIPPKGFLLVWADSEPEQNSTNWPDLHVDFKLDKTGEFVGLFTPDGTAVSAVSFGAQSENISQGQFPDGTGALVFMPVPTPAAANVAQNMPPSLPPIPDQFLHAGQTLSFTVQANDNDLPAQMLWFSLEPGSPLGASISPSTGLFSWTAPTTALPATNQFTIRVTDNGTPPLSDTRTFSVQVFPPPALAGAWSNGDDRVTLSFASLPGKRYQLEFKSDLDGPFWTPLGNPMTGTGNLVTVADDTGHSRRFYRLILLRETF
jgi:hypothetical protein